VKQCLVCILDSFNKFLQLLTDELPNALPPHKGVDHKIEMMFGVVLPSKAPYRLKPKGT
jgi:hypothetical protein